jgi:hypothetical protein
LLDKACIARKWREKDLIPKGIKRGNRAEVRRERKKRDILSPVNVFYQLYQKALNKSIFIQNYFISRINKVCKPTIDSFLFDNTPTSKSCQA